MQTWQYKIVPTPHFDGSDPNRREEVQFEEMLNELGTQGWEMINPSRIEVTRRSSLGGLTRHTMTVLAFKRPNRAPSRSRPRVDHA